jgi:hypothetical protein
MAIIYLGGSVAVYLYGRHYAKRVYAWAFKGAPFPVPKWK